MTEKPILFSGPMVKAILDGRKTQTRRVVTRTNSTVDGRGAALDFWDQLGFTSGTTIDSGFADKGWAYLHVPSTAKKYDGAVHRVRSRIEPSDRLWVRETFALEDNYECGGEPPHDDGRPLKWHGEPREWWQQPHYRATDPPPDLVIVDKDGEEQCGVKWRPSIYMPRWASRITLAVMSVRVERLQAITEEDAKAEGVTWESDFSYEWSHRDEFELLWEKINGKRPGCSWADNPWVWVVGFSRDCCWPHKADATVHHSQCPHATDVDRSAVPT